MKKRKLGNSSLEIVPLAFGGNVFGWTADETRSFELLDAFVEAGFNFIDTANVYSTFVPGNVGGESETIIGNWLKRGGVNRDKVIIASKVGVEMESTFEDPVYSLSRESIIKHVEDSLQRLQTDYIDLYQSHIDDPDTPLEEVLQTYDELIKAGKVRAIGSSNYTADRLQQALKISQENNLPRYESAQPQYNLYDRQDYEGELQDLCVRENIGVITYFSLACGFLTGKYRVEADLEGSSRGYRVKEMMNERGFKILGALDRVALDLSAKPSQVALAWVMAQDSIVAPIASATSLDQLQEIVQSVDLVLSQEHLQLLGDASA